MKIYGVANLGDFTGDLMWLKSYYGNIISILGLWGIIVAIKQRNNLIMICVGYIIVIFLLFTMVQDLGIHHYYLIDVFVLVLVVNGIITILNWGSGKMAYIPIIAIMGSSFLICFFTQAQSLSRYGLSQLTSEVRQFPRYRNDISAIQSIAYFINMITKTPYEYTYVLSSSHTFSDDTLRNVHLPYNLNPIETLVNTRHWDLRDGVPTDFFKMKYVVIAEPYQLMYGKDNQHVVWKIADIVQNDPIIRGHYQRLTEFEIEMGVVVAVYQLTDIIPVSDIERVNHIFEEIYPDEGSKFKFIP